MRPLRWSPQLTDEHTLPPTESDAELVEITAAPVPEECPGVFVEQPLERWSPRDLIGGVFRLARWTRLATS